MYHFFVDKSNVFEDEIHIVGSDVNHILNVLRMEEDDRIIVCDGEGYDYKCSLLSLTKEVIRCKIHTKELSKSELPIDISLFQGAPKQDKMELIIQKSVELGVKDIKPVTMKRSVVKFDSKKLHKKVQRWQKISESAAKQSKRGLIPKVFEPLSFKEMLTQLVTYDMVLVPYENEKGMDHTREVFAMLGNMKRIAIVIGPEGGFSDQEINTLREMSCESITLGNRILRTETAGLACIAMISYQIEEV